MGLWQLDRLTAQLRSIKTAQQLAREGRKPRALPRASSSTPPYMVLNAALRGPQRLNASTSRVAKRMRA
eukprot:362561-Chlamydomonas_euryale.AAC.6